MSNATNFGGWIPTRPDATGTHPSLTRWLGWMAVAGSALTSLGTGGELSWEQVQRSAQQPQRGPTRSDFAEVQAARSPAENLARIREVLDPGVSELASTFGVSRQSIYNWLNGESVAEANATRLRDLAEAADVLAFAGVKVNASLLKRKFANGRTLMQLARDGESARNAASMLVRIHERELAQRERTNARFATRTKTPASSDFDLPAAGVDA